ncbi:MAG: hypothetical protein CEE40_01070 [Chloroflexi bacterium B3_Chlor]|nr:MAG: hypothetical protein CEE40_01070 [Chloroflexi bacterium B3_Chlor]
METTYTYDEVGNRKTVTDAIYLYGLDIIAEQLADRRLVGDHRVPPLLLVRARSAGGREAW